MKTLGTRIAIFGLFCGALTLLTPAGHAQVTFYPSIAAQQMYTSNLNFVSDQGEDLSDTITRASVSLPVAGQTWTFLYRPSIQRYSNNPGLDNISHLAQFDWNTQMTRYMGTTLSAFYSRSQVSGDPNDLGIEITLNPRGWQETGAVSWGLSRQVSARWTVTGSLQGSTTRTSDIEGVDNSVDLVTEDKNAYSLALGGSKSISASSDLGFNYFYRTVDADVSGGEDLHSISLVGSYRLGRSSVLNYGGGAFTRGDRYDFQGRIGYDRDFQVVRFSILAERQAAIGGSLAGTSNNTTFAVFVGSSVEDKFVWTVSTRYLLREAANPNDIFGDLTTWAQTAGFEYRPHRSIGLRLSLTHSEQSGGNLEGLDGEFATAIAGFVWYPLGYGQGVGR